MTRPAARVFRFARPWFGVTALTQTLHGVVDVLEHTVTIAIELPGLIGRVNVLG